MTIEMDQDRASGLEDPSNDSTPGIEGNAPSIDPTSIPDLLEPHRPDLMSEFEQFLDADQGLAPGEEFVFAEVEPEQAPEEDEGPEFNAATTAILETLPEDQREAIETILVESQREIDDILYDSAANQNATRSAAVPYRGLVSVTGNPIPAGQMNIATLEERTFGAMLTQEQRVTMLHVYQNKEQFLALFNDEAAMERIEAASPRMRAALLQMKQDLEGPNGDNFDRAIRQYQTAANLNRGFVQNFQTFAAGRQETLINRINQQLDDQGSTLRVGPPQDGTLSLRNFPGLATPALPAQMTQAIAGLNLSEEQQGRLQHLIGHQYQEALTEFHENMSNYNSPLYRTAVGRQMQQVFQQADPQLFGRVLTPEERYTITHLMQERGSIAALVADEGRMLEMQRENPQLHRVVTSVAQTLAGRGGDQLFQKAQQYQNFLENNPTYQDHLSASFRSFQEGVAQEYARPLALILRGTERTGSFTAAPIGTQGDLRLNINDPR